MNREGEHVEVVLKKSGMVENTKKVNTYACTHVYVFMYVQILRQCVVWQGMSQGSLPNII